MPCDGQECYNLIYQVSIIHPHEFRIARLYVPGDDGQSGCTSPTEDEEQELIGRFEESVARRLEDDVSAKFMCPDGCRCIYNGRFSEWSAWEDYAAESIEVVTRTSRAGGIYCRWKLRGKVKMRYRKKLGDCFRPKLFDM